METLEVAFSEQARLDLRSTAAWLLSEGASEAAIRSYQRRLERRCERIGWAPRGGRKRDVLLPGLRSVPFERSATVYYRVEPDRVLVLRILRRGRDVERAFTP